MITAFIGKGGVGKTSIASACALLKAKSGKTAIVSSDFMPSLKHIFRSRVENLDVIELSEKEVSEKWKERYGNDVNSVLKEFVDVEDWILDHIAGSPGVAEEFMIANIVELEESGEYENIVWDTAASSSTMHLLLLEREFYEHLDRDVRIFLRLRNRFRVSKAFEVLEEWKKLANNVWDHIQDTRFVLVSTEDELSLIQADEIEGDLSTMGIEVNRRIYNRSRGRISKGRVPGGEIPELSGDAMEIVREMVPYLAEIIGSDQPGGSMRQKH